jgi:TPR repeat protein
MSLESPYARYSRKLDPSYPLKTVFCQNASDFCSAFYATEGICDIYLFDCIEKKKILAQAESRSDLSDIQKLLCLYLSSDERLSTPERKKTIYEEAEALAEKGLVAAYRLMGQCCLKGNLGHEKSEKDALKAFKQGAAKGDPVAEYLMFDFYVEGRGGVKVNPKKAFKCLSHPAELLLSPALYKRGLCFSEGKGCLKDEMKAYQCFKKAADQGNDSAMYQIGNMYLNGVYVKKDLKNALRYLSRSAAFDNGAACFELAQFYDKGEIVVRDLKKCMRYYSVAAGQHFLAAAIRLPELNREFLLMDEKSRPVYVKKNSGK